MTSMPAPRLMMKGERRALDKIAVTLLGLSVVIILLILVVIIGNIVIGAAVDATHAQLDTRSCALAVQGSDRCASTRRRCKRSQVV